jgi:predicted restriction endonuclease
MPLSADFKYSYALVEEIQPDIRNGASPDTASPPPSVEATITRIVRDTALICRLKVLYNDTCQICRTRLELSTGRGYSEGHHLQPLGAPHHGPDMGENIIIVCPNCHALLDRCSLLLRKEQLIVHSQHTLGDTYIKYHNTRLGVDMHSRT